VIPVLTTSDPGRQSWKRRRARTRLGKQIASTVLPSEMYEPATTDYHSDVLQQEIFGLGEIRIDGPHSYTTEGFRLVREDGPAIGPKLGRNEPCWCGSTKKFKRCHGSPSSKGQTLTVELQQGRRLPDGSIQWPDESMGPPMRVPETEAQQAISWFSTNPRTRTGDVPESGCSTNVR